ncbi:MAG: glycosyltransferase, partial [Desulfobacterales bacterium]|nr:glycosyltransferase [Desulfobacterales bacterium]
LKINTENVILCFGYLWPNKGYEYVVQAMPKIIAHLKSTCLLLVGPLHPIDGLQYYKKLTMLVRELKLEEHVIVKGRYVPENQVDVHFSAASVVVLPYLTAVGASGILARAFSCRKPVIASDVGSLGEYLDWGRRGLLVCPASSEELAAAIVRLLTDADLRRVMINNIESYISANNWIEVARKTHEIYQRAIQQS